MSEASLSMAYLLYNHEQAKAVIQQSSELSATGELGLSHSAVNFTAW